MFLDLFIAVVSSLQVLLAGFAGAMIDCGSSSAFTSRKVTRIESLFLSLISLAMKKDSSHST